MTIFQDFVEANHAVSFFIRVNVPVNFQQQISLNNDKTNEKLVVKAEVYEKGSDGNKLLISRHSSKAAKHKLEEDEKEVLEWEDYRGYKRICLMSMQQ
jgi:hypothetical protein